MPVLPRLPLPLLDDLVRVLRACVNHNVLLPISCTMRHHTTPHEGERERERESKAAARVHRKPPVVVVYSCIHRTGGNIRAAHVAERLAFNASATRQPHPYTHTNTHTWNHVCVSVWSNARRRNAKNIITATYNAARARGTGASSGRQEQARKREREGRRGFHHFTGTPMRWRLMPRPGMCVCVFACVAAAIYTRSACRVRHGTARGFRTPILLLHMICYKPGPRITCSFTRRMHPCVCFVHEITPAFES